MSYKQKATELYDRMARGEGMQAFDEMYHNDVVVIENPSGETRNGKEAQRKAIEGWFSALQENHGGGVNRITSDEDNGVTMVESWMDVTFKDGNRMQMTEVAVQDWQDGQIIREEFFYNDPTQGAQQAQGQEANAQQA